MNELGQPYFAFKDFTDDIALTSPNGLSVATAGAVSERGEPGRRSELSKQENATLAWIASAVPFHNLNAKDFDILYIAGSDNSMTDMGHCMPLTAMLEAFVKANKPIAAVGLAVISLMSLFMPDGAPYVKGRKLTSFTNKEVMQRGLQAVMPFSLESRLQTFGAAYSSNPNNRCNVVKDGMLVTGQNAASSAMAVLTLRSLSLIALAES
jgi:putative intracellular protease/amidase